MSISRDKRLSSDLKVLNNLKNELNDNSHLIDYQVLGGQPPDKYLITIRTKGYISFNGTTRNMHAIRLELPPNYPVEEAPRFFFVDEPRLLHPNIWRQTGLLCLFHDDAVPWRPYYDLDELIKTIIKMIRFAKSTIHLEDSTGEIPERKWREFMARYSAL